MISEDGTMGLGDQKAKFLFTCEGFLVPRDMRTTALDLVKSIGMRPARRHPVDDYPYDDGQGNGGGYGFTLFQPLMESYLVIDVYYDRSETEILISTCMPDRLNVDEVVEFLTTRIGPTRGGLLRDES